MIRLGPSVIALHVIRFKVDWTVGTKILSDLYLKPVSVMTNNVGSRSGQVGAAVFANVAR